MFSSGTSGGTSGGDVISASTLNVTKVVSFFVAIFAGITQALKAADMVSLSSGQMVAIWLTVAGLIVLLGIADMSCRTYATSRQTHNAEIMLSDKQEVSVRVGDSGERRPADLIGVVKDGDFPLAHVEFHGDTEDHYVLLDNVAMPKIAAKH